jgi:hypothetical protein
MRQHALPVYLTPLADPYDDDDKRVILDRIDDSVSILSRQLFAPSWTILGKGPYFGNDTLPVRFLRNGLDLSNGRCLDQDSISCHCF